MTREEMLAKLHENSMARSIAKRASAAGVTPRQFALEHAKAIRQTTPAGTPPDHPYLQLADLLEAGEFDHELAGILGYT